jgi:hypothetical protein
VGKLGKNNRAKTKNVYRKSHDKKIKKGFVLYIPGIAG